MSQPDYNKQQPGFPPAQYPPPGGQYPPPGYDQAPVQMQPVAGYPQPGQPGQQMAYGVPGQPGQPMGYGVPGQPMGYAPPGQQFSNVPIMQQPQGQASWMPMPQGIPNCPPGLEYLTMIDQILVHQQIEIFEMMSGVEGANKYRVKNSVGQDVYFAAEDSDFCSRNCFGNKRPFDMKIVDNTGREVIHLYRPCRCDSCCYPCCLQKMEVSAPVGEVIGYVEQEWSLCPSFVIKNASEDPVLRINGPCCVGCGCSDVNFHVLSLDGKSNVGKIQKQWGGFVQESYSDADNFGITFPMDLDVRMKAVMMGACFLIDFVYFEKQQNRK